MPSRGALIGGRYRLAEQIGVGANATVWKATHVVLNRPVAVKFIHIEGRDAEKARKRFMREARVAAAVVHRSVVSIIDYGSTEDGHPYMVMELLEGESLADRLAREAPLSLPLVVRIAARTLSGLAVVHDAGIVHRDLKPENIYLVPDADGVEAKLLDFGISRSVDSELESVLDTRENVIAGTPHYMSPEQARGLRDVDHRSDIYTMGVIVYEMLTGDLPFDSENVGDLLLMIVTHDVPSLMEVRRDLGPEIAAVIARATARNRDERYPSARAMRQELIEAVARTAEALESRSQPWTRSDSEFPRVVGQDLLQAVGDAYEPGDSGLVRVDSWRPVIPMSTPAQRIGGPQAARAALRASEETVPVQAKDPDGVETLAEPQAPVALPAASVDAPHDTIPAPPRRSGLRRLIPLLGAVLVGMVITVVLLSRADSSTPAIQPAAADEPSEASGPDTPDTVTVTLVGLPSRAVVTVDGQPHDGGVITLPRGQEQHDVEVRLPGGRSFRVSHLAMADGEYEVPTVHQTGGARTTKRHGPVKVFRDPGF